MDCERFESLMRDEPCGGLDDASGTAATRHAATCVRCASLRAELRAARREAAVPVALRPNAETILAATWVSPLVAGFRQKSARALSLAGSWAMRPQTAMVAVFLVMLATSVLLLRGKSARTPASAEVIVTERGTPAPPAAVMPTAFDTPRRGGAITASPSPEARQGPGASASDEPPRQASIARAPMPVGAREDDSPAAARDAACQVAPASSAANPEGRSAPAPADGMAYGTPTGGAGASPFEAALNAYRATRYDEAARAFDALAPLDFNAELWAARSVREAKGCRGAIARFDRLAQRARQTPPGWDALLEGALCQRALGDFANARARLKSLLAVDSHKDRATAELDRLDQMQRAQMGESAAARAAPKTHSSQAAVASDAAH